MNGIKRIVTDLDNTLLRCYSDYSIDKVYITNKNNLVVYDSFKAM